jgi:3,5-epimerase/4-reductase
MLTPANIFKDNRGELLFPFKAGNFNRYVNTKSENNQNDICQCTVSKNKKNVFRGMHSNKFNKLVTCANGSILDIIVNLDRESDDYLAPKYFNLNSKTDDYQLFVPKNYAHGFLTLDDNTIVIYHFDGYFRDSETIHINYLDPYINIAMPIKNPIISEKDNVRNFTDSVDYVLFGGDGFIGSNIYKIFCKNNKKILKLNTRLENIDEIKEKLLICKPKYVINAAGIAGVPNIYWCNDNKTQTIETNITFQLTLAKICHDLNIHLTVIGSGAIFDDKNIYSEMDKGNFDGNFYSEARINLENILRKYDNVLYLRVNYPISSMKHDKNLLTKLMKFKYIESKEMSITCLDTLFPILPEIIENNEIGPLNFVNSGHINLVNIAEKYKLYDENYAFTVKYDIDVNKSSPKLSTEKIERYNPLNIFDSVDICFDEMLNN